MKLLRQWLNGPSASSWVSDTGYDTRIWSTIAVWLTDDRNCGNQRSRSSWREQGILTRKISRKRGFGRRARIVARRVVAISHARAPRKMFQKACLGALDHTQGTPTSIYRAHAIILHRVQYEFTQGTRSYITQGTHEYTPGTRDYTQGTYASVWMVYTTLAQGIHEYSQDRQEPQIYKHLIFKLQCNEHSIFKLQCNEHSIFKLQYNERLIFKLQCNKHLIFKLQYNEHSIFKLQYNEQLIFKLQYNEHSIFKLQCNEHLNLQVAVQ